MKILWMDEAARLDYSVKLLQTELCQQTLDRGRRDAVKVAGVLQRPTGGYGMGAAFLAATSKV